MPNFMIVRSRFAEANDPVEALGLDRPTRVAPQPTGLTHGGEGCRDQQLVFLPDGSHSALRRPGAAELAGLLTDAAALAEILVPPGMNELVEPAELAGPAGRQRR